MTIIRFMRGDEVDELAQLFQRIWHETQARLQDERMARHRDLAFFRKRVDERQERTLVAVQDNRIAGFSAWTGGKLNSLFVDLAARRHGLGAALCSAAENHMSASAVEAFELTCIAGNDRARGFYEQQGWHVRETVMLEAETPEGICRVEAWHMVKPNKKAGH